MESDKIYNVTVEGGTDITVTVSTIATVEISNNPSNLGTGAEVFAGIQGDALTFKTLKNTDGNIDITETSTEISIDMPATLNVDLNGNTTGTHFGNVVGGDISVNNITSTGVMTTGNVVPSIDNHFTLGTPDKVWKDIYIGNASLYIDGHKVLGSDPSGDIDITTDPGQNLNVQSGGDLYFNPLSGTMNIDATTLNLGPQGLGTATAYVHGTLDVGNRIEVGTTDITDGIIDFTGTNQNGTIRTNGAAYLFAETGNMYVGSFADYTQIQGSTVTATIFNGTLQGEVSTLQNHTTDGLDEGNFNLYYTDARVDARIPNTVSSFINDSGYITSSSLNGYALESYVDQEISNLIAAAPGALDTLNELAAAIGDDPNFASTITNQLATKFNTADFTSTADTWLATKTTDNLTEGTNLYYTDTRFDNRLALKTTTDIAEGVNLYYTDGRVNAVFNSKTTDDLTEGSNLYYTEARVDANFASKTTDDLTEGTNEYYTDSKVRNAISLTTTNNSELSYDPLTGVFSYVSPTTVTAANAVEIYVRNQTGSALAKGKAVYIAGHSGTDVLVEQAQNDVAGEYPAIGLVSGTINNNSNGYVTVQGELAGVDTTAFNVGDVLYLSELPGELTNVRPSGADKAIQNIGKVARSHSSGIIIISGSGRANDVPNLDHLEVFIGNQTGYQKRQLVASDIADINNTNPQAGDVLTWDAINLEYTPQSVSGSGGAGYIEGIIDSHLNVSTATSTQLLSWNGTDYDWVTDRVELTDLSVTTNAAGTASLTYDNTTGVFTYTPPDISDFIGLTDLSITTNPAGSPALTYNNTTGVFTYTPADISDFIALNDLSVSTQANSGSGALSYDISTGIFTYTPPDLTGYLTTETDTLQTTTNRGAATTNTCIVPFYYQDQAAFPNATTYHGAMAHSHVDGSMYFAHAAGWKQLANQDDVDTALGDISTALTTILGS